MKRERLHNRLSEQRMPALAGDMLIDKPLDPKLGNSLLSEVDSDIQETADGYKLELAVPGMKKKHLKVEVADGVLTVLGQKQLKETPGWAGKVFEVRSTRVYKTLTLPEDADVNGIKAKCRNGLLKINIPKAGNRKSFRNIPVELAEEKGHMNWWRRLINFLERLEMNISAKLRKLGLGSTQRKPF